MPRPSARAAAAAMGPEPGPWLKRYTGLLSRRGWVVLVGWMAVTALGLWRTPTFFERCTSQSHVHFSSPGVTADTMLAKLFPLQASTDVTALVLTRRDGAKFVLDEEDDPANRFFEELLSTLSNLSPSLNRASRLPPPLIRVESAGWTAVLNITATVAALRSALGEVPSAAMPMKFGPYAHYRTPDPASFLANGNRTQLMLFRELDQKTLGDNKAYMQLDKVIQKANSSGLHLKLTGNDQMWDSVTAGMEHDLVFGDGISIPSALILLCYTLRSPRYFFVPIMSIASSTMGTFLIMSFVAQALTVSSVAPNIIMVLAIALSVEWREELLDGASHFEAVMRSLFTAGHTIFVSGATLICCCFGLLLVPLDLLQSLGVAAAVIVTVAMLVNTTLTPALFLTFPRYFERGVRNQGCCSQSEDPYANYNVSLDSSELYEEDYLGQEHLALIDTAGLFSTSGDGSEEWSASQPNKQPRRLRKGGWYNFGAIITKGWRPAGIVAVIAGVCGYLAYPAATFTRVGGIPCFISIDEPTFTVYKDLTPDFGAGTIWPYEMLVAAPQATLNAQINRSIAALMRTKPQLVQESSVRWFPDASVMCATCNNASVPASRIACENATRLWWFSTDNESTVALIQFGLSVDQWGAQGTEWLLNARDELSKEESGSDVKIYLAGGAAVDIDLVNRVYNFFPRTIAYVAGCVIVLMTFAFRSIVISVKAVVSIGMTLSLVYGAARFVYEDGVLDSLHFYGLTKAGGLCWIPPVLTFCLLIGFGLDYHIFLLSRVVEFRLQSYTNRQSVLYGLSKTGRIITFAGLIMAVAFIGLLPAHEAQLSQLSFIAATAVLIDTFLIRGVLIPSMMSLLGPINWWPRRMPSAIHN